MPRYNVTDPDSGTTLLIEGDSPPNEQELTDIFAAHASSNAKPAGFQFAPGPAPTPTDAITGQPFPQPNIPTDEELARPWAQRQAARDNAFQARETQKQELHAEKTGLEQSDTFAKWLAKQNQSTKGLVNAGMQKAQGATGGLLEGVGAESETEGAARMLMGEDWKFLPASEKKIIRDEINRRAGRTAEQQIADTQKNPIFQTGKELSDTAAETFPVPQKEQDSFLTGAAGAMGSFFPLVATGPAAPLTIGLQSYGEHIDHDFQAMVDAGVPREEAAQKTLTRALASGGVQAGIFWALPHPLRKLGDKYLIDKFAPLLGEKAVTRFIASRAAQAIEGGALGATSRVGENVVTGQPIMEGVGESAAGLALLQAGMPRGPTKNIQEQAEAFGSGPSAEANWFANRQAAISGAQAGLPGTVDWSGTSQRPRRPTLDEPFLPADQIQPHEKIPGQVGTVATVPQKRGGAETRDLTAPVEPETPVSPGDIGAIPELQGPVEDLGLQYEKRGGVWFTVRGNVPIIRDTQPKAEIVDRLEAKLKGQNATDAINDQNAKVSRTQARGDVPPNPNEVRQAEGAGPNASDRTVPGTPEVPQANEPALTPPDRWTATYAGEHTDLLDAQRRLEDAQQHNEPDLAKTAKQERDDALQRLDEFDKLSKRDRSESVADLPAATIRALRDNPKLTLSEATTEGQNILDAQVENAAYDAALDAGKSKKEAKAAAIAVREARRPAPPAAPAETPVVARIKAGIDPQHVRVTVQHSQVPGDKGFVQVDENHPELGNTFSSNPEALNEAGFKMPSSADLFKLPQGQYTLPEAIAKLKELGKEPASREAELAALEKEMDEVNQQGSKLISERANLQGKKKLTPKEAARAKEVAKQIGENSAKYNELRERSKPTPEELAKVVGDDEAGKVFGIDLEDWRPIDFSYYRMLRDYRKRQAVEGGNPAPTWSGLSIWDEVGPSGKTVHVVAHPWMSLGYHTIKLHGETISSTGYRSHIGPPSPEIPIKDYVRDMIAKREAETIAEKNARDKFDKRQKKDATAPTQGLDPKLIRAKNRLAELVVEGKQNSLLAHKLRARIAEMERPKRERTGKTFSAMDRFRAETTANGDDILSWINENARMLSWSEAKATKSEDWMQKNGSLYDDRVNVLPHHSRAIYGGKSTPDQVARDAHAAGVLGSDDVSVLWQAIEAASKKRRGAIGTVKGEDALNTQIGKELEAWHAATGKRSKKNNIELTTEELKKGDFLEVGGERIEVVQKDADGTLTLKDGTKFGRQDLKEGDTIYVEKFDPKDDGGDGGWPEPEPEKDPHGLTVIGYNDTTKAITGPDGGIFALIRTIKKRNGSLAYEVKGYKGGGIHDIEGRHPDLEQTYELLGEQHAIDAAKEIARREIAKRNVPKDELAGLMSMSPDQPAVDAALKAWRETGKVPEDWVRMESKPWVIRSKDGGYIGDVEENHPLAKELLEKIPYGKRPFQPDDKLIMLSPHTGDETIISYRGPMPDGKAVVWSGKTQFQVPMDWLRRPENPEHADLPLGTVLPKAKPKVAERPLTKAEQKEFGELSLIAKANRESGGPALTTEQTKRYEFLTALAGQKDLLAEDAASGVRSRIKQLLEKAAEMDRLREKTQERAWASKHRRKELLAESDTYAKEASAAREQARELEQGLSGKKPPGQDDMFGGPPRDLSPGSQHAKAFYSRITRTVEQSPQAKATGAQWKATIRNSKLGINRDEYALVGVDDLEDGKSYTKAEVLEYLKANEVEVRDVTLGADRHDLERGVAQNVEFQNGSWKLWDNGELIADANTKQEAIIAGVDYYTSHPEIESPATKETHFSQYTLPGSKEGSYREVLLTVPGQTRDLGAQHEARSNRWKQLKEDRDKLANLPPGNAEQDIETDRKIRNLDRQMDMVMRQKDEPQWTDGHEQYKGIPNPIVRIRMNEREVQSYTPEQIKDIGSRLTKAVNAKSENSLGSGAPEVGVRKGVITPLEAAQYSHAKGFRSGFDQRGAIKRILFLEEVQAPQKGEFEKMPALFQKNWREIAFKWALRHAAENGFDSLGYTTGDQQAARYDLSKHVDRIEVKRSASDQDWVVQGLKGNSNVIGKRFTDLNELDAIIGKDLAAKARADLEKLPDSAERAFPGESQKPDKYDGVSYSGVDLKIGGEGLKRLYDTDFLNVVNSLPVVKKAGQKVGEGRIPGEGGDARYFDSREEARDWAEKNLGDHEYSILHDPDGLHRLYDEFTKKVVSVQGEVPVHSLTITPEMRDSIMAGQAQFHPGDGKGKVITPGNTIRLENTKQIRDSIADPASNITAEHKAILTKMLDSGLLDQLPGLRLEITDMIRGQATGEYLPNSRIARFLRWSDADVPVHEFMHDLWYYLNPKDQEMIRNLRLEMVDREAPQMGEQFRNGISSDEFLKQGINRDLYHLANESEFFTWMMTERAMEHMGKPEATGFVNRIREIIQKLWQAIKDAVGLSPAEDALFRKIISGKYKFEREQSAPGERELLPSEEKPEDRIRAHEFGGEPIGILRESESIPQQQESIRKHFFDGSKKITKEQDDLFWQFAHEMTDKETAGANAGVISRMVGDDTGYTAEMAPSLLASELRQYALRSAIERKDRSMLEYLVKNDTRFALAGGDEAVTSQTMGRGLRGLREFAQTPFWEQLTRITEDRAKAAGEHLGIGIERFHKLMDAIDQLNLNPDEVEQVIKGGKTKDGRSIEDIFGKPDGEPDELLKLISMLPLPELPATMTLKSKQRLADFINKQFPRNSLREKFAQEGADKLERAWWSILTDKKQEPEAKTVYAADKYLQRELSGILQETLAKLGYERTNKAKPISDPEALAVILGKHELRKNKWEIVDQNVRTKIEERRQEELAKAEDDEHLAGAINEKFDQIADAWDEASSSLIDIPASDRMLRRMIHAELKDLNVDWNRILSTGEGTGPLKKQAVEAAITKVQAAMTSKLDLTAARNAMSQAFDQIEQKARNRYEMSRARRPEPTGALANQRIADGILNSMEKAQGAEVVLDKPKRNIVRQIIAEFLSQDRPKWNAESGRWEGGAKPLPETAFNNVNDTFKRDLTARLMEVGVNEKTAQGLAQTVLNRALGLFADRQTRRIERAASATNVRGLIEDILRTPYRAQHDPQWRREMAMTWFMSNGLSREQAGVATKLFNEQFDKAYQAAGEKAARKFLENHEEPNRVNEIVQAIRLGLTDPNKNWADDLAAREKFVPLTAAQQDRLAKLEQDRTDPALSPSERASIEEQMMTIFRHAGTMDGQKMRRLSESFVASLLSGVRTVTIQLEPLVMTARDLSVEGLRNPSNAIALLRAMKDSWKHVFLSELKYAWQHDAYGYHLQDIDRQHNALKTWWEKLEREYKSTTSLPQKAWVRARQLVASQQYVSRFLSSIDQAMMATAREWKLAYYASTAFKEAGITDKWMIGELVENVIRARQAAYDMAVDAGIDSGAAKVRSNWVVEQVVRDFVADATERKIGERKADSLADQVLRATENDMYSMVGRRGRKPGTERSTIGEFDEGFLSRPMNHLMEFISKMRGGQPSDAILSTTTFGFVNIPFRTLRYWSQFGPYGLFRQGIYEYRVKGFNAFGKRRGGGMENPWKQMYGTELQAKARFREAVAGTIALGLATAWGASNSTADDDANKKKFGLYITGHGPDSKVLKDAWIKQGWQQYSLNFVINGYKAHIPLTRVGEAIMFPFIIPAAIDDAKWRKKEIMAKGKPAPNPVSNMAMALVGEHFSMTGQKGMFQTIGQYADIARGEGSMTKLAANQAATVASGALVPWKSMLSWLSDMIVGPLDQSSISSMVSSKFPILGYVAPKVAEKTAGALGLTKTAEMFEGMTQRPAINRFGDQLYDRSWYGKMSRIGLPIMFQVAKTPENEGMYTMLVDKGVSAPEIRRYLLEEKYGPLTNGQFSKFSQISGDTLKKDIQSNLQSLQGQDPVEVRKYVAKAATAANQAAADQLGLESVKPSRGGGISMGGGGGGPSVIDQVTSGSGGGGGRAPRVASIGGGRHGSALGKVGGRAGSRPRMTFGVSNPARRRSNVHGKVRMAYRTSQLRGRARLGLRKPRRRMSLA